MDTLLLVDFNTDTDLTDWSIVDDIVMGGRSAGHLSVTDNGYGLFHGHVSLENNGGFSSVRYAFEAVEAGANTTVRLRIKGDRKDYQFRIKDRSSNYYSYMTTFATTGDWQTIEIRLGDMYPVFRGQRLQKPNFDEQTIEELTFLISNKTAEDFALLIDRIELLR